MGAVRGEGLTLDVADVELNTGLLLELDPALNQEDASRYDLLVTLSNAADENRSEFEGGTAFLVPEVENGEVIAAMFDQYGETVLAGMRPRTSYFLQVELGQTVIRIENVKIE